MQENKKLIVYVITYGPNDTTSLKEIQAAPKG